MVHEGKIIQYIPNGHKYLIDRDISSYEAKMVLDRLEALAKFEGESTKLDKRERMNEAKPNHDEDPEYWIEHNEIAIARLDISEQSTKVRAELDSMLRETLRNCFNLTIADIDKIDTNEQQAIFLQLAELCR